MGGRRDANVSRRNVFGELVSKSAGEISIVAIAAVAAGAGGASRRAGERDAAKLEASAEVRASDAAHAPSFITERGSVRLKADERLVVMSAPAAAQEELVDSMWLRDADTGEVLGAIKNRKASVQPQLPLVVKVGTRLEPLLHTARPGQGVVWKGEAYALE